MADKDVEQTDEWGHGPGPWWAGLGTRGAVGLIVFGALAAAWVFFRLPGTPEEPASGYYLAAKLITLGLVIAGGALLSRRRARTTAAEETNEPEHT